MTAGSREESEYQEAIHFLFDRINFEKSSDQPYTKQHYRLNRMRRLLAELDDPHLRCPVIHIAGTKGKGSTAWLVTEMLRGAGYRTGRYTSPHLIRLEERFAVDGLNPSPAEVISMVERLRAAVQRMSGPNIESPTFFELTTAMAWLFFVMKQTDFAVIEVGMGGRLDSTNVCSPTLTVITSISFDHEQFLGNTLKAIAAEKAGIIKSSVPVISGVVAEESGEVIATVAKDLSAPLRLIEKDFRYRWQPPCEGSQRASFSYEADPRVFRLSNTLTDIPLKLMGSHQAHNAALACACIDWLREMGFQLPVEASVNALGSVQIPARLEIVGQDPTVIVDAAHNEASFAALIDTLNLYFPKQRRTLIFAVSRDKKYISILKQLVFGFDSIVITQFQTNPRAVEYAQLERAAREATAQTGPVRASKIIAMATPREALQEAIARTGRDELIVVAGSFFLAAELLPAFRDNE